MAIRLPPLARVAICAALFSAGVGMPARALAPAAGAAAVQEQPKQHQHSWVKQSRKDWVPPDTRKVQVGVDAKGRPIFETKIVKPGYWKTVTWFSCSCGARRS